MINRLTEYSEESKLKSVDLVLEAFKLMENRELNSASNLLEEIKKKLEKEFTKSETYKEKIIVTKICIFVDGLIKCYNPEKEMFLRSDLLPLLKREKIKNKIKKYLTRINEHSARKRSDSTWKKFGKSTIERKKENQFDAGMFFLCEM